MKIPSLEAMPGLPTSNHGAGRYGRLKQKPVTLTDRLTDKSTVQLIVQLKERESNGNGQEREDEGG